MGVAGNLSIGESGSDLGREQQTGRSIKLSILRCGIVNTATPTMANETRIRSLYAELRRAIIPFGLLIAAAWLFAAFSFYLSRKTGADWFARSGAVMALVGAAVTFRLANFYQRALATALKEELVSVSKEIELHLDPPKSYVRLLYFGYLTGVIGTGIWGYGDLLVRLIF